MINAGNFFYHKGTKDTKILDGGDSWWFPLCLGVLQLVVSLPDNERVRLVQPISALSADYGRYATAPPQADEFAVDDDALSWEADGWDEFY